MWSNLFVVSGGDCRPMSGLHPCRRRPRNRRRGSESPRPVWMSWTAAMPTPDCGGAAGGVHRGARGGRRRESPEHDQAAQWCAAGSAVGAGGPAEQWRGRSGIPVHQQQRGGVGLRAGGITAPAHRIASEGNPEKAGTWCSARMLDPAFGGAAFLAPVALRVAASLKQHQGRVREYSVPIDRVAAVPPVTALAMRARRGLEA